MAERLNDLVGSQQAERGYQYRNLRFYHAIAGDGICQYWAGYKLREGETYPTTDTCPTHGVESQRVKDNSIRVFTGPRDQNGLRRQRRSL